MISYKSCFDEMEKLAEQREQVRLKAKVASAILGHTKLAAEPYRQVVRTTTGPARTFDRAKSLGLMGAGAGATAGGLAGAKFAPGLWKLPAAMGGIMAGGMGGLFGGAALGGRGLQRRRQVVDYYPQQAQQ